jgi:N-acetylmuramoyl-L-alanine amidase
LSICFTYSLWHPGIGSTTGSNEKEQRHGLVNLKSSLHQRRLWGAVLVLAVFAGVVPAAHARARHSDAWARERFANAERMREAMNGKPPADRSRRDYQRVLNAYRNVYLGAPTSSKADPSVVAVAETLVEMGRHFDDDKILQAAIRQYQFLRREYPGSKFRLDGLFTIGEIYKDDLNDPNLARTTFGEYLRRYPNSRLAGDARHAMAELNQDAQTGKSTESAKAVDTKRESTNKNEEKKSDSDAAVSAGEETVASKETVRAGRLPRVTGIRHWSTPDYTRVAIDVEGDVKFSAQRIDQPARIFFDLRDTRLASTLVGKSVAVGDGFLKKVRLAQFAPGRTRIVLEVDNLSEYDAFLLPNPYRLIIDIHGKTGQTKQVKNAIETALAAAQTLPSQPEAGTGTASASPEVKRALLAHATIPPPGKGSMFAGDGGSESAAAGTKAAQAAVVKKVVDADDDEVATLAAHEENRNSRDAKAADAAKALAGNLDDDSKKSESKVLKSHKNHIVDVPHQSGSRATAKSAKSSGFTVREATPTASGDRSLIRALGLKIGKIVIDPGHGGHDTGTIGPKGLEEKDLVLEVSRRLGKLLEARLGAEVVYTRKDDTFIPLETRTAIANQARADLFVSIHANSSRDTAARGVETYYLNFTSSPEALEVAARENAVSEKSIYELQDLVKKIALKEKIEESREFAWDVQQSLHSGLAVKSPAIRDRGVKKAPFIVLIGANMPSILAEISFVSNPTDEHRLATSEYRQRIAESLYRGIAKYVNGLSGVKVASKIDKAAGQ